MMDFGNATVSDESKLDDHNRDNSQRGSEEPRGRAGGKSVSAFRTISEVSVDLDVPQHVLRFWESKFTQLRPLKRGGGRRYYRPEDVALLRRIHGLLYKDGYTIKGVQKVLRTPRKLEADDVVIEAAPRPATGDAAPVTAPIRSDPTRQELLQDILVELRALRSLLD